MASISTLNLGLTDTQIMALLEKIQNLPTAVQLNASFSNKQDSLTFDSEPTENSSNPVASSGIYSAIAGKMDSIIDATPTENSTNPVTSGGVYAAISNKQDSLTFDSEPTENSINPVTSSGIYSAIAGKMDSMDIDQEPTENSTNLVTSGGIYDEFTDVYSNVSNLSETVAGFRRAVSDLIDSGSKNRLKMEQTSTTISGITITVNDDKSITLNGTNSSDTETILLYDFAVNDAVNSFTNKENPLQNLRIYTCVGTGDSNARIQVIGYNSLSDTVTLYDSHETGTFTASGRKYYVFRLVVSAGATFDNLTIYPMICLRTYYDISSAYVPYCPTTKEIYEYIVSNQ